MIEINSRKLFSSLVQQPLDLTKPYIRFVGTFPFPITFKGTVADIEATGLSNIVDKIITLGFNRRNLCYIYQLWDPLRVDLFRRICINLLSHCRRPFFSYSTSLEQAFLGFKRWEDLLQYGEGYSEWNDEPYFYRMSCHDAAYLNGLYIRGDVGGEEVPRLWRRYRVYGDFEALAQIFYHSYSDILKIGWLANRRQERGNDQLAF